MLAVPQVGAVATPLVEPMVATSTLPLLHSPGDGDELSVVVPPSPNTSTPVIGVGSGFTVISKVCIQPEPNA